VFNEKCFKMIRNKNFQNIQDHDNIEKQLASYIHMKGFFFVLFCFVDLATFLLLLRKWQHMFGRSHMDLRHKKTPKVCCESSKSSKVIMASTC
jgi:hypothetical protein